LSTTSNSNQIPMTIKGRIIREDVNGFICLDDVCELASAAYTKQPRFWRRSEEIKTLEKALLSIVRNSHNSKERLLDSVIYARRGRFGATFAHPVLAAKYAGYLSADLEIEVRQVWLRYRAGDPTLADEILERASDEGNRWVANRAITRVVRRKHTDVLQEHGVSGPGFGRCTNATYRGLWAKTARQIQLERRTKVTRDGLEGIELAQVALSEGMATDRITEERCWGDSECAEANFTTANFVREAMERERASRRPRRLGV
jgi:hypothetical protein